MKNTKIGICTQSRPPRCFAQSFSAIVALGSLMFATSARAHHAMGGQTPVNALEGLISGIAHPVIGLDHLAFIVAVGLLASVSRPGLLVAGSFMLAAMVGTALHVIGLDIPGVELLISGSVLLFGVLLVIKHGMGALTVLSLAAMVGLFHGYAYGEAIFRAETQPLLAHLVGFTLIQLLIAVSAFGIGKIVLRKSADQPFGAKLRPAGLVLCGIGIAFLFSQVMDLLVPLSNG